MAFFVKRISRPLSKFARAADEFGRGKGPDPLEEQGPEDLRRAAQAFNRMQRRLSRTLETQRTMLRAVGHDLRTPLTSLRIRSEMIPKESNRDKFIATIDDLTLMTEEILGWAKDASTVEQASEVDLVEFINSVFEDFSEQDVSVLQMQSTNVSMRRLGLKRALSNIIGNALKYAGSAVISYEQKKAHHIIHVDDDGSGIPEHKFADAMKPFVRLEESRNKKTGGSGLGLSIAESILQVDGGKLVLSNRSPNGLRASLYIPK